jgi:hypothetical protein
VLNLCPQLLHLKRALAQMAKADGFGERCLEDGL